MMTDEVVVDVSQIVLWCLRQSCADAAIRECRTKPLAVLQQNGSAHVVNHLDFSKHILSHR
jgi:hypothetical protein